MQCVISHSDPALQNDWRTNASDAILSHLASATARRLNIIERYFELPLSRASIGGVFASDCD